MNKFTQSILLATSLTFGATANAALIDVDSVSGTGTYNHSLSLLTDGVVPSEYTAWTHTTNVYWSGAAPVFTFDFGSLYNLDDVLVSADLNDSYRFDYSTDNANWNELFTIEINDGNVTWGMDTMSSDSSHAEYVANMDFTSVQAQYLRFYATGGDGLYALGEVQAFGSAVANVSEPSTLAIFALALSGLVARRFKKA